jgi:hypothetical protein
MPLPRLAALLGSGAARTGPKVKSSNATLAVALKKLTEWIPTVEI